MSCSILAIGILGYCLFLLVLCQSFRVGRGPQDERETDGHR